MMGRRHQGMSGCWTAGADYAACQRGGLTPLGRLPIRDEKTKTVGFPCCISPAVVSFLPVLFISPPAWEPQRISDC